MAPLWEPKVPLEQGLKKTIEYFDGCAATGPSARSGVSHRRPRARQGFEP
jgi:hypothetical protein